MKRNNLSSTYSTSKVNLEQLIDDIEKPNNQEPLQRPVSAGGQGVGGIPPTLAQEHLQFVDGIDEVPEWLRDTVWALITRMNQLTYIDSDFDFERMMCGVRSQLRPLVMKRKLSLIDMQQIEYYVGVQLRKSKKGIERRYIVPGFQDITHREMAESKSVIEEPQRGFGAAGMVGGMQNRRRSRGGN
ncbi:MAG: hypothetical protein PHP96_03410 [Candidatus Dojkabacteria bacterium]|nr:hypothetical protein [Candidatus Dojkabacteria bacterium]MDD3724933.1 hypothetical protein [Bacteroidales bacterium]